ncbi:FGGY-family carbohydrate kinase [Acetobacterium bakii]|uniref:Xylulose kinase n=1 Tax=Acetobacterium bakii TaxID=52689 RepID=A0A0L6TXS9_9FIRM|nr:FGGY-family carbohydrate kinase [Acetobacterium bakii]KNZ41063.1 xylulose kinase [Acetobacterium bakii]
MGEKVIDNIVITIDCGTKGIRGILFDDYGNELGKSEIIYDGYYSKNQHWKEAPPLMFWNGLVGVIQKIRENYPKLFNKIQGMNIACQRDIITVVDETGEPLRDFISWLDRRTLEKPLKHPWPYELLFKAVGFSDFAKSFSVNAHAHWIKVYEPEIWEKADKLVFLSTYLLTKLTGKIMDSRSATTGHVPFDYKRKEWCGRYDVKSIVLQIEPEKRYELVGSCEIIGHLTASAAALTGLPVGLPVVSSGSDKGCETLGVGAITPNTAGVSLGTQATVQVTTTKYVELFPFYPAFPAVQGDSYNPEITIYHGFWMVDWYIDEFLGHLDPGLIFSLLEDYLIDTKTGADGLIHQPYWGREAYRPEARGSLVGFREGHNKKHIYRAIIEGLGFGLLEGIERIESKTNTPIESIGLTGGGSRSDGVAQIMADIFNRPVHRVQTNETTGLGGAMATFVGLGRFQSVKDAGDCMVRKSKTFKPDAIQAQKYTEIYNKIYKRLYRRLKPLYKKI